jgi:hypothetical protein
VRKRCLDGAARKSDCKAVTRLLGCEHEEIDIYTYAKTRGRVSDDELRAAFAYTLKPDVPDDKFHLALQLFVEMERRG